MKTYATLLLAALLSGCVESGDGYRIAEQVEPYLAATKVIPADTRAADRTHKGRIVYMAPGNGGNVHFTYYEVTSNEDIAALEAAAKVAVEHVSGVNTITLHFMERQVFHTSRNGSGSRGHERELRKVVVRRRAAT